MIKYLIAKHLLIVSSFAFGTIDPGTSQVKATSVQAESLMSTIGNLKLIQQDLQIWIAIGGKFDSPSTRMMKLRLE